MCLWANTFFLLPVLYYLFGKSIALHISQPFSTQTFFFYPFTMNWWPKIWNHGHARSYFFGYVFWNGTLSGCYLHFWRRKRAFIFKDSIERAKQKHSNLSEKTQTYAFYSIATGVWIIVDKNKLHWHHTFLQSPPQP